MGKKLQSLDLELYGVTRTFEFDPPQAVGGEDENEVAADALAEVVVHEVNLVDQTIRSARVEVSYTYHIAGTVTVDLDDVDAEDAEELQVLAEGGEFDEIRTAIEEDIAENFDSYAVSLDGVDVESALDEDGMDIDV